MDLQEALDLLDQGELEDAVEAFSQAAAANPGDAHALIGLSKALGRLGRIDQSLETATAAIAVNPGSAEAHYYAAVGYGSLGRIVEAKKHVATAIQLAPNIAKYHVVAAATAGRDWENRLHHFRRVASLDRRLLRGDVLRAYVASWVGYGMGHRANLIVIAGVSFVVVGSIAGAVPGDPRLWDLTALVALLSLSVFHLARRRYVHAIWVLGYCLVWLTAAVSVRHLLTPG